VEQCPRRQVIETERAQVVPVAPRIADGDVGEQRLQRDAGVAAASA
jgi:hypothetical protein